MTESGGTSVRRPADKVDFMESLQKSKPHGAFPTYRDAMIFCAAVGWRYERKIPFEASAGPIDWSTMINRFGTEDLVDTIAFADSKDVEILDPKRLTERIRIFECYANGGLEVIDEIMKREALTPAEAVHRLVVRELESRAASADGDAPDIRDLGRFLGI